MEPNNISEGGVSITDVWDAINKADPTFSEKTRPDVEMQSTGRSTGTNIGQAIGEISSGTPYVKIIEQPASKALRFRYECESRTAGSIPGISSTPENKTYPTIQIVGFRGRAIVVVSCVTRDSSSRSSSYLPHPHHLVGKETCSRGVCTVEVSAEDNMTVVFNKLGVQCVKRRDIEDSLRQREEMRVDPFRTGFDHKRQPTSIDLNAVRLCFQAFLEGPVKGEFRIPLMPVVSTPVYDKKAMCDLVICKLSHCSASVAGGMEMVLLCEKVTKEDIQVRFFEEKDDHILWEALGDFQPTQVHKQVAISFRTPSYRTQQVDQPVQVFIQLRRPSDNATSEPLPFQLLPLGLDDPDALKRKRQKFNNSPNAYLLKHMQHEAEKHSPIRTIGSSEPGRGYKFPQYNIVKTEPTDGRSPYGGAQMPATPSLQMFNVENPPNMGFLPIPSPSCTQSPPEYSMYDISPAQQQPRNILQPVNVPQGSPSPMYTPYSSTINQLDNNFQPFSSNDAESSIETAIKSVLNTGIDNQHPSQFDLNFSPFDNGDLNSPSISDIVKEAEGMNGEQAAGTGNDIGALDSFTKMCILNDFYKSSGNN